VLTLFSEAVFGSLQRRAKLRGQPFPVYAYVLFPGLVCEIPALLSYAFFGRAALLMIPLTVVYLRAGFHLAHVGQRGALSISEFRIRNIEQAAVLSPLAFLTLYHLAVVWGYAKK